MDTAPDPSASNCEVEQGGRQWGSTNESRGTQQAGRRTGGDGAKGEAHRESSEGSEGHSKCAWGRRQEVCKRPPRALALGGVLCTTNRAGCLLGIGVGSNGEPSSAVAYLVKDRPQLGSEIVLSDPPRHGGWGGGGLDGGLTATSTACSWLGALTATLGACRPCCSCCRSFSTSHPAAAAAAAAAGTGTGTGSSVVPRLGGCLRAPSLDASCSASRSHHGSEDTLRGAGLRIDLYRGQWRSHSARAKKWRCSPCGRAWSCQ